MRRDRAIKLVGELWRVARQGGKRKAFVCQALLRRASVLECRRAERVAEHKGYRITKVWVSIDKVKSTQGVLRPRSLVYHLRRHPYRKRPIVIALSRGFYLLWDGNHRVTAAAMLGRKRIQCDELRRSQK